MYRKASRDRHRVGRVEDVDNGAIREDCPTDTWQNPKEMRESVVWYLTAMWMSGSRALG